MSPREAQQEPTPRGKALRRTLVVHGRLARMRTTAAWRRALIGGRALGAASRRTARRAADAAGPLRDRIGESSRTDGAAVGRGSRRAGAVLGRGARGAGGAVARGSRRTASGISQGARTGRDLARRGLAASSPVLARGAAGARRVLRHGGRGLSAGAARLRRAGAALEERTQAAPQILGLPVPLLAAGLAIAATIGLLLSYALVLTTRGASPGDAALEDGMSGNILPGIPVLTEESLGPEVQTLYDTGYIESAADFDLHRCLEQQGITQPVLVLEQAVWEPETTLSWVIVHSDITPNDLQQEGGAVEVAVVRPSCGTGQAQDALLWNGSTMLKPSSPA